ncbi:MAG: transketolase [Lachnospiraceae bacterium]
MYSESKREELKEFAKNVRIQTLEQLAARGFGHLGGAMSMVEILTVLYQDEMKYDPKNPKWEQRDQLVCSKGHGGPSVYSTLALCGFFPVEELKTLNQPYTNLPSHCDMQKTKGIDITTGSLGQGLSVASGVAHALKITGRDSRVYCIVGDGELQEGQNWEAIMNSANKGIDNLVLLVDHNHMQLDGEVKNVNDLSDLGAKLTAFKWNVVEVADGHDVDEIKDALVNARACKGVPTAIICNTLKGKGVVWAETEWNHHIEISKEQADIAIAALNA